MISWGRPSEGLDTSGAPPRGRAVLMAPYWPPPSRSRSRGSLLHPGSSIDTPAQTGQVLTAPRRPRPPVPVVRPSLLQACPAWRVSRGPVGVFCIRTLEHCHPLGRHSVPGVAVHVHGCSVAPDGKSPPSRSCLRPSAPPSHHIHIQPYQEHNTDQTEEYRYPHTCSWGMHINKIVGLAVIFRHRICYNVLRSFGPHDPINVQALI